MDKFKEYLEKNLMDFAPISDYVVEIGGKTFELYQPAYDGALFDDGFNFVGIPADPKRKGSGEESVETSCDFYAFSFGGDIPPEPPKPDWYREPKPESESGYAFPDRCFPGNCV